MVLHVHKEYTDKLKLKDVADEFTQAEHFWKIILMFCVLPLSVKKKKEF